MDDEGFGAGRLATRLARDLALASFVRYGLPKVARLRFRMADPLIRAIRANYDRLATQYAVHLFDELQHKPFDREVLTRFAEQTRTRGNVCDIGCGPGHVTKLLYELQVSVFGIDLSPVMVGEARRRNPGLEFRQGDVLALHLAPNSLVGIVAFYAIVNLPEHRLAEAFSQMWRVLQGNGLLLVAFHVGNEIARPDELWAYGSLWIFTYTLQTGCAAASMPQALRSKTSPSASRTLTLNTKVDAPTSLDANAESHPPRKVISQRN